MTSNKTNTDRCYRLIEQMERKKRWLILAIIGCFSTATLGLGLNAFTFMAQSHLKGDLSYNNIILAVALAFFCIILLALGINRYILLRNLENKLDKLEMLEETIYNEVLKSKID